jgi:multidrug transporter EmrE-like cation transporter
MTTSFTASLPLIIAAVICGVGGQLSLKAGMSRIGSIDPAALAQPIQLIVHVLLNPLVAAGLLMYVVGAGAWLGVLSKVPLSLAYPLLAASYAVTPVLAWLVLGEAMPSARWLGIGTICAGVFLVARS